MAPGALASDQREKAAAGQLFATSTGPSYVEVQGKLILDGYLVGGATLEVKGNKKVVVTVGGARQRPNRRGVVRLQAADTRFSVQAPNGVRVRIDGQALSGMELSAFGKGQIYLSGAGSYSLRGYAQASWPSPAGWITIAPPPRKRAPELRPKPPSPPETPGETTPTGPPATTEGGSGK